MTNLITTYSYQNPIYAVINDGIYQEKANLTMLNNKIKIHKLMHCPVYMEIRNINRKLQKVIDINFFLNIYDPHTNELILTKLGIIIDEDNGRVQFIFNNDDFRDYSAGLYNFSIKMEKDCIESFLYLDQHYSVIGQFELLENAMPPFKESIYIAEFKPQHIAFPLFLIHNPNPINIMANVSSKLDSWNSKNLTNGEHTFAIKMINFTGYIIIQGTLSEDPNDNYQTDWFNYHIQPPYDYATYMNFSGVDAINITGALRYCRLIYLPDPTNVGVVKGFWYRS